MQKTKLLDKSSLEILKKTKRHAKEHYKNNITSIAALLKTKDGKFYTGINVRYENIWKCICAERLAIVKAIEDGRLDLDLIVSVKYSPKTNYYEVVNMCGDCLQIAINYPSLKVIVNDKGILRTVLIKDVLPFPYA